MDGKCGPSDKSSAKVATDHALSSYGVYAVSHTEDVSTVLLTFNT